MIYKKTLHFIQKYSSIQNLSKKELWFLGAFIFVMKLLMVVLISFFDWKDGLSFYTNGGDDGQYIGYSENLYQTGEYFYDFGTPGNKEFIFRMPGITFLYLPIRFFLSQNLTINFLVILQVLFSTIATLKFLELSNKYFKINNLIYLLFSAFYFYSAFLESTLMTESLALSSLLMSIYFIDKSITSLHEKEIKKDLIIGGVFITWLIFLRPFMVPFLLVFSVYVLIKKRTIFYVLLFLFPFIVLDGLWFVRNYKNHNEIVFLQKGFNWQDKVNQSLGAKFRFIQAFGFKIVNFEEGNHATWFNNKNEARSVKIPPNSVFPDRTFVGDLTIDSLIQARTLMHKTVEFDLDGDIRIYSDKEAARILDKFVSKLKEEHPFDYYIGNRIRLFFSFIEPNTPKLIVHAPYPYNVISSKLELVFSGIIKYIGIAAIFIFLPFYFKDITKLFLFFAVPLYVFTLFPFVLKLNESRFFYLAYPFLVLLFLHLFSFIKKRENG